LYVGCHHVDGAGNWDDDDEEPEDAGGRVLPGLFLALSEEPPSVQTRRLAKFVEKIGGVCVFNILAAIGGSEVRAEIWNSKYLIGITLCQAITEDINPMTK